MIVDFVIEHGYKILGLFGSGVITSAGFLARKKIKEFDTPKLVNMIGTFLDKATDNPKRLMKWVTGFFMIPGINKKVEDAKEVMLMQIDQLEYELLSIQTKIDEDVGTPKTKERMIEFAKKLSTDLARWQARYQTFTKAVDDHASEDNK